MDGTYIKVAGRWVYLYRVIDQCGQVIDVLVSKKRDLAATRRFFIRALHHGPSPIEVTTATAYPRVLDELVSVACHVTEHYANNRIEADHGRRTSDCDRCAASNSSTAREASAPGTRSSRTSTAATTNSGSRKR